MKSDTQTRVGFSLLLVASVLILGAGCQTFNLTEDQFQRQQGGQIVDRETGEVVGAAGTAGYYGACLGQLISSLVK